MKEDTITNEDDKLIDIVMVASKSGSSQSKSLSFQSDNTFYERDKAEIQLVGLIMAIKGFAVGKPKMTMIELDKMLPRILKFAKEILIEPTEEQKTEEQKTEE